MIPTLTRLKLLSAFQALTLAEGSDGTVTGFGVSHARARDVICEMLDLAAEELPNHPPRNEKTLEDFLLNWLGLELV